MYILVKLSRYCVLTSGWGKVLLPGMELRLPNYCSNSSLGIIIPAFVPVPVRVTTIERERTTMPHRVSSPRSHVLVVLACISAIAACRNTCGFSHGSGVATVLGRLIPAGTLWRCTVPYSYSSFPAPARVRSERAF
ncbi:hypothetical protein EDD16DRAFT_1527178 [Pisolithus croceorrhizus]|nr:hypothetical protein EDD16DRAFT_1527178 [Pisolithus croceorrhizus]